MAAYTGTTQVKQGASKIWLAVIAFAVAAALVIAVLAMQGGSSAPSSTGNVQTSDLGGTTVDRSGTGFGSSGEPMIVNGHLVCSRCAP